MRTSITIPDDVFHAAERVAKRLSLSRSELYATALREFLNNDVTARLNKVYAEQVEGVAVQLLQAQVRAIEDSSW